MRRHTIHRTALAIILSLVANASPAEPRTDSRSITADIEREMTTLEKTAVLPLYQAEYIQMLNETCLRAPLSESSAVKLAIREWHVRNAFAMAQAHMAHLALARRLMEQGKWSHVGEYYTSIIFATAAGASGDLSFRLGASPQSKNEAPKPGACESEAQRLRDQSSDLRFSQNAEGAIISFSTRGAAERLRLTSGLCVYTICS